MTTKEAIIKAMEQLPEDASYEEAMEQLYVLYKVQKGMEDAQAGNIVSHEEARKLLAKWLP